MRTLLAAMALGAVILPANENYVLAQNSADTDPLTFADLADLAADSPVVARVKVKQEIKVPPERAPNAPAGTRRVYAEAQLLNLIRGESGLPASIRYVIDLPTDSRGRTAKMRGREFLLFGKHLGGGNIQLTAPDSQILWTPPREERIRSIVREAVAPDAAPRVTGIGSAFHVPGTIIGEGETQVFLETATGDPVSLTIISRENQQKQWAVSLSEIVDEAAEQPRRNSLLWYRLACSLPQSLPVDIVSGSNPANAARAQEDYRLVMRDLGTCTKVRSEGGLPIKLY